MKFPATRRASAVRLFAVLAAITALCAAPLLAGERSDEGPSVEMMLAQVDLSVTMKHYEKVRGLQLETELQLSMSEVEKNDKDREMLTRRIELLRSQVDKLRESAVQYDAKLRKLRASTEQKHAQK